MNGLYEKLAEILDEEQVGPGDILRDFDEWDSLSVLSIVAYADSVHRVTLTAEDIAGLRTAGDLATLLQSKKG